MLAVAFDTLKLARKLESAGFPSKQAQDMPASLAETFTEWQNAINLATKEDVQLSETRLESKIADSKAETIKMKAEIEKSIAETKSDLIRWVIGVGFAQIAMLLAAIKLHF